MYSFSYLEPVCSMPSSNCCFLTCIQISREVGQVVWYSHLFQNFPQYIVIHTIKGFGIVNKAEIVVFWNSLAFSMIQWDVGNLISVSSAFSKTSLNIWNFMVHILLKPGLEKFQHYFTSMWDECNCAVVWAFFGIAGPITSWQIDGKTMVTVTDFILLGSKITAVMTRHLLLGRKAITNLDILLKSRDITLPTNVHLVKAMVLPVVTYGCESWTIKKS